MYTVNTRGSVLIEVLVLLATVIATSIAVLLLVQFNVIDVSADGGAAGSDAGKEVLNVDFLPVVQEEGVLVVKDFEFCGIVNQNYDCIAPNTFFYTGDSMHFRYAVGSSTRNSQILLVKKYRLLDETGRIWIEADERNTLRVEEKIPGKGKTEQVLFRDSVYLGTEMPPGEYALELVIENPLIEKKVKSTQRFMVEKIS